MDDETKLTLEACGLPTTFGNISHKRSTNKIIKNTIESTYPQQHPYPYPQQHTCIPLHIERYTDCVTAEKAWRQYAKKRAHWINTNTTMTTYTEETEKEDEMIKRRKKRYRFRHRLFAKFDNGIAMDDVGWYSVTPEALARHQAHRMRCNVVVDAFAGVGGNAIALARTCTHVIAIERDPVRMECAINNAKVYGVEKRIEFIMGDFRKLATRIKADAVFLAPPWSGPSYTQHERFDIGLHIPDNGIKLFLQALSIATNVGYFLPRHTKPVQIAGLAKLQKEAVLRNTQGKHYAETLFAGRYEIEHAYVHNHFSGITAYFGAVA